MYLEEELIEKKNGFKIRKDLKEELIEKNYLLGCY
jgi:hypothetical protein